MVAIDVTSYLGITFMPSCISLNTIFLFFLEGDIFILLQVLTVGALHQADSVALRVAASAWHNELATLPKPLLVVNVGGPTGILLCIKELISYNAFPVLLFKILSC